MGLVAVLGVGVVGACTAWDDVPLPGDRSALDGGSPLEATTTESGSDAGPLRLPADGFVTEREAIDACTVIAACPYLGFSIITSLRVPVAESILFRSAEDVGLSGTNFSFCVDQLSKTFEPARPGRDIVAATVRKIATATSCGEAGTNVLNDFHRDADPRCTADAGHTETCIDNVTMLACDGPFSTLSRHCNAAGGLPSDTCLTLDGGVPIQGCVLPDGVCPFCEGSVATLCNYADPKVASSRMPARAHTDCKVLGLECAITPGGLQVGCASTDHVVREDVYAYAGAYCVNSTVYLSDSTFVGLFDCAAIGAACAESSGAAVCTMPDAECTPFSTGANECSGSKIHLCVGGHWKDVDCPMGCDAPDGSAQRAACRSALADGG
jgi:hypothetical protein